MPELMREVLTRSRWLVALAAGLFALVPAAAQAAERGAVSAAPLANGV